MNNPLGAAGRGCLRGAGALLLVGAAVVLAGCASPKETATFVTRTSFSMVDVDTVPATVSFGYDRVEGYIGPRYANGEIYPVAGILQTEGRGIWREISQIYATGRAARIATAAPDRQPAAVGAVEQGPAEADGPVEERKVVFFGTSTSVGLKLGFADGSVLPNAFTLGYKRKEAATIPVDPGREPSVLGSFNNAAGLHRDRAAQGQDVAFEVEQYFATGEAAENLAGRHFVQSLFADKAREAMGDVAAFRQGEARQGRLALDTLNCFVKLPDDQLPRVWGHAEDIDLFTGARAGALARIRAGETPQQQRERYVGELSLLDAADERHTQALDMHRRLVCRLAAR